MHSEDTLPLRVARSGTATLGPAAPQGLQSAWHTVLNHRQVF